MCLFTDEAAVYTGKHWLYRKTCVHMCFMCMYMSIHIDTFLYVCVCVCVWTCYLYAICVHVICMPYVYMLSACNCTYVHVDMLICMLYACLSCTLGHWFQELWASECIGFGTNCTIAQAMHAQTISQSQPATVLSTHTHTACLANQPLAFQM